MEKDEIPEFADDGSFFSHLNIADKKMPRERSSTTVIKKKVIDDIQELDF